MSRSDPQSERNVGSLFVAVSVSLLWLWTPLAAQSDADVHWAYRPLHRPAPPTVREVGWTRGPIDAFVLRGLEERGLQCISNLRDSYWNFRNNKDVRQYEFVNGQKQRSIQIFVIRMVV